MSALVAARGGAAPRVPSRLAGTGALYRLALRRSRVMFAVWVYGLAAAAIGTASSYIGLYSTEASRRETVQTLGHTPATLALYGRIYVDSVGGLVGWRLGGLAVALAGLMSILLVVRHTRGDEESGRTELVGAGAVSRHAPLAAALLVALSADVALGVIVTLGLIVVGLGAVGSLALGLAFASSGAVFAAVAAVAAQAAESARAANSLAIAALGGAYVVRAVGDAGAHWLSWLSPLGWTQQLRPFAGERWWLLVPLAALTVTFVGVATRLAARRDLGAGLLPQRPGPATGSLHTPLALAWRLQRGALATWVAGFALLGAVFGSIASDVGDIIGDSKSVRDAIAKLGGESNLVDAYLAATFQVLALIAAVYAIGAVLRARTEETSDRAEPVLAAAVSRTTWALGHIGIASAGTAALLGAAGLPAGIAHAVATGDAGQVPRVAVAALAQVPAAWVLAGVAVALFGLAPRATAASWGLLAACLALSELGPILDLPRWAMDLSPLTHSPQLPGGTAGAAPAVLALIAAALALAGLAGLRRRDLG